MQLWLYASLAVCDKRKSFLWYNILLFVLSLKNNRMTFLFMLLPFSRFLLCHNFLTKFSWLKTPSQFCFSSKSCYHTNFSSDRYNHWHSIKFHGVKHLSLQSWFRVHLEKRDEQDNTHKRLVSYSLLFNLVRLDSRSDIIKAVQSISCQVSNQSWFKLYYNTCRYASKFYYYN